MSCRCVDQKVMRPFHFAPARAAHSLPSKLQFTSHTHIHCGEYRNSIDEAGGKANERKSIFLVQPWFVVKLVIVVRFTE